MRASLLAAAIALLPLGGCAVGPDFTSPGWSSPASWFSGRRQPAPVPSAPAAAPIDPDWWAVFGDPRLTALERQVAGSNLDVQAAGLRIAESRAQLRITGASQYPTINANTSYEREKPSNLGIFSAFGGGGGGSAATQANGAFGNVGGSPAVPSGFGALDVFQYGFDASWEPDLWGRVRRSIESARATAEASADARRAALLSALAEVGRDYIDLRGTQEQLRIARENLRTARQSLALTQERAAAGLTADLDVANASAQVSTVAAQIPALQQHEQEDVNALSLLLGRPPNALASELAVARPVPPVPARVPVGFPSELARRRPDIRQAEAQLHTATADVGVAVASFYPQVTLNASLGFQALQFGNLFKWDARQYGAGPGITLPIFQGGQLRGTLELRRAQQREAAVNYQKTVLSAWHDVDNALTAYEREQQRRAALVRAVEQNRRALSLAQSRYQQGFADFLPVLTAEQALLSTEQALASSVTTVSTNLVALYKALGGGWESFYPDATQADSTRLRPAPGARPRKT
ncbi:MAG: efflux transporter outer membrane subunit [Acetobacteraceae bacterium]|nr:efflux transporter outer membrane subunit [Acetobacteraceae bacterium]